jgi:hypothetical protein
MEFKDFQRALMSKVILRNPRSLLFNKFYKFFWIKPFISWEESVIG